MPMLTAKKKQVPADIGIKRINSGSAYEPQIGYCRGVVADGWVLISGTTGNDHATMIEAGLIDPAMKIEIEVTACLPKSA
jgi:enamine deaminase RidA (YjgF/YER057c/UK114 family)